MVLELNTDLRCLEHEQRVEIALRDAIGTRMKEGVWTAFVRCFESLKGFIVELVSPQGARRLWICEDPEDLSVLERDLRNGSL